MVELNTHKRLSDFTAASVIPLFQLKLSHLRRELCVETLSLL